MPRTNGLDYSATVRTLSPPPRYQPTEDEVPSITGVISQSPPRERHMRPPLPAVPIAPSGSDSSSSLPRASPLQERKASLVQMTWPPEENVPPTRQYAASSRSSLGQGHSPTFESYAQPMVPSAPSKSSHDSNAGGQHDSTMHTRGRSSYEAGPSSQPYNNGMRADNSDHPARRQSIRQDDPYRYAQYTPHTTNVSMGHNANGGGFPPQPSYPQQYPHHFQQPSPPLPAVPAPLQHNTSGFRLGGDTAIYYFRSSGHNSMTMYTFDNTPCYHVEVTLNCFNPSSYLTTIRRASQQGEFVASFEMGISTEKATLCFGPANFWLKDVFQPFRAVMSSARGRWVWRRDGNEIEWSSQSDPESKAHNVGDTRKKTIAKLIPPTKPGQPRDTLLEVHHSVQGILDDIVVSSIIVERKRQTPTNGTQNEHLFN